MARIGGLKRSIARICTGEVCVRRSKLPVLSHQPVIAHQKVSYSSRAG
jgi:hypothetical protein